MLVFFLERRNRVKKIFFNIKGVLHEQKRIDFGWIFGCCRDGDGVRVRDYRKRVCASPLIAERRAALCAARRIS
jgi:hypothetical protein